RALQPTVGKMIRDQKADHQPAAADPRTFGRNTIGTQEELMGIRRGKRSSTVRGCISCVSVFLWLVPAISAQVTTGTSPAGLYYEASGVGEAVVLIHAFSVDRRMWAPQIAVLEGRFQVIRYDLRGHGKSEGP